jgi:hypothetical protein
MARAYILRHEVFRELGLKFGNELQLKCCGVGKKRRSEVLTLNSEGKEVGGDSATRDGDSEKFIISFSPESCDKTKPTLRRRNQPGYDTSTSSHILAIIIIRILFDRGHAVA